MCGKMECDFRAGSEESETAWLSCRIAELGALHWCQDAIFQRDPGVESTHVLSSARLGPLLFALPREPDEKVKAANPVVYGERD